MRQPMVFADLIGKSGCRLLQRSGQICLGAQPAQVAQRGSLGVGSTLGAVPIGSHGPAGRSPGAHPGAAFLAVCASLCGVGQFGFNT